MEYLMYSVKDELTGKFMSPMFVERDDTAENVAIRQFKSNVNTIKLWKDNPNDYSLYLVGLFNDETGASATAISKIISGRSVIDVTNEAWRT